MLLLSNSSLPTLLCLPVRNAVPLQYQQYDPERKGVPVTRHTAAPAMLVRRGYDVKEEEERAAEAGEVRAIPLVQK